MAEFDETIQDNIDRYLQGQMGAEERSRFDQAIAGDPLLRDEVNFQRNLINAVKHARRQELKEYIKTHAAGYSTGAGTGMKIMKLAAAFLLAGGAAFFIYTQTKKDNEDNQIAKQEKVEEGSHGAGQLADMPPKQQSDSAVPEQGQGAIADNSVGRNDVQPAPVTAFKKHEETERKQAEVVPQAGTVPGATQNWTYETPNNKNAAPDKEPVEAPGEVVYVQELHDTPQPAASGKSQKRMMRVDFNPSADLTGYRVYTDHLELFGITKSDVEILQLTDSLFLKMGDNIYMVSDRAGAHDMGDTEIRPLVKVTDKTLLRRLKQ
jgi:hypothetical protein